MPRREFPTAVRVAAHTRSGGRCEHRGCGAPLITGRWQLDHIIPDSLGGAPVLANAQCLCEACWREKNPKDTRDAAKAKRREAKARGAVAPKQPINSAPFLRSGRREANPMPALPPRRLFIEA